MKARRAFIWLLVGGAPLCSALWISTIRPATSAQAPSVLVQAAWADLLPDIADAAPPEKPAGTGRGGGGLTPFQRHQRLMEFVRQQSLPAEARTRESDQLRADEATEWKNFLGFFERNSPNRFMQLSRQSPGFGSPVRTRLLQRWLTVQQLQQTQPDLYNMHVSQFQHEDVVFGLATELRRANRNGNAARANNLREQIRAEAGMLVGIGLTERDLQIKNAHRLLDDDAQKLSEDMLNKSQLDQQKATELLQQAEGLGSPATPAPDAAP